MLFRVLPVMVKQSRLAVVPDGRAHHDEGYHDGHQQHDGSNEMS